MIESDPLSPFGKTQKIVGGGFPYLHCTCTCKMWIRCDSDVATGGSDAVPWLDGYYDEDDNDHHYDQNLSIMINFGWDKDETDKS